MDVRHDWFWFLCCLFCLLCLSSVVMLVLAVRYAFCTWFFIFLVFARAVVKVLNGAAARLYFSGPGIKLKPVRTKVHSEN